MVLDPGGYKLVDRSSARQSENTNNKNKEEHLNRDGDDDEDDIISTGESGVNKVDFDDRDELIRREFPLSGPLIQSRHIRKRVLEKSGRIFTQSVSTSDSWLKTVFLIKERAADIIFWPWLLCTIFATILTIVIKVLKYSLIISTESIPTLLDLVLTTALAFLMVYRLNRAALRWWDTRTMWGTIIADARDFTACILEHVNHSPKARDHAISWLAGFIISTKQHLRDDKSFNKEEMAGFVGISEQELTNMHNSNHPCLYALASIRHSLHNALKITDETPAAVGFGYASTMRMMEKHLDSLVSVLGGLERIKATPLPIVVVTHLRTFLLIYLLLMPILQIHVLGWATIPVVSLTSYILLEIDGAATECECPFRKRASHLAMELYCLNVLNNIQDLYIEDAQRRIDSRVSHSL